MRYVYVMILLLSGCANLDNERLYYQTSMSISKDQTMSQIACWAAISEIARDSDNSVKVNAIALAEKCKSETIKLETPKKSWFVF